VDAVSALPSSSSLRSSRLCALPILEDGVLTREKCSLRPSLGPAGVFGDGACFASRRNERKKDERQGTFLVVRSTRPVRAGSGWKTLPVPLRSK
jgi:hypothetical protein